MNIRDEINKTLHAAFPDIKIYGEKVPQFFKRPCFSPILVDAQHVSMLGRRRQERTLYDIRYFPADGLYEREDCEDMAQRLEYALEILSGNTVKGTDMQYQIADNVLHFKVHFNWFERLLSTDEMKMEDLEVHSGIQIHKDATAGIE